MEDRHKEIIRTNFVRLVDDTALDEVLCYLIEERVFSDEMAQKYRNPGRSEREQKHDLYLDIPKRGPRAWNGLIQSLLRAGHFELAQVLDPDVNADEYLASRAVDGRPVNMQGPAPVQLNLQGGSTSRVQPFNLASYQVLPGQDPTETLETLIQQNPENPINLGTEPTQIAVIPATERKDLVANPKIKTYRMASRPKGFALIINNIQFETDHKNRTGAEVDSRNLKALLEGLGYEVTPFTNLGYNDMKNRIEEFRNRRDHSRVDSCVVALLSHGQRVGGRDEVIARDGRGLAYDEVIDMFNSVDCSRLNKKPKLFIFQTCRGTDRNYFIGNVNFTDAVTRESRRVSDMMVACSTVPGFVSNRDRFRGTWFIDTLCRVFMQNAHDTHLSDLLMMVDQELNKIMCERGTGQTSCFDNRGFGHMYFNPGLYDTPPEP